MEAMSWKNVPLEDLERVLATSRQEVAHNLKKGLWMIGTVGSLAPYIGLFGTVVGIMRAFREIAIQGDAGFEVVSAGISEALIATAVGLLVAIVALLIYNWLQVNINTPPMHLECPQGLPENLRSPPADLWPRRSV